MLPRFSYFASFCYDGAMASMSAIFRALCGLPAAVRGMAMEPCGVFPLDSVNRVNFRRLALVAAPEHRRTRVSPKLPGKARHP